MRGIPSGLLLWLVAGGSVCADCPAAPEILGRVAEARPERGARTTRFGVPVPQQLYERAAHDVSETFVSREGKRGSGVTVARLPVETIWMAINDEDAHDMAGDYLPLVHSEVIGGTPHGPSRLLFQYAKKMGVGRWWVSRVWMDRELFVASGGQLWQVTWEEDMDAVDRDKPPVSAASSRMPPIASTRGAWLLVPVAADCTLVEHYSQNDAGGAVDALQFLVMGKALHHTVHGMVRLASERYASAAGTDFVRPDGNPLR